MQFNFVRGAKLSCDNLKLHDDDNKKKKRFCYHNKQHATIARVSKANKSHLVISLLLLNALFFFLIQNVSAILQRQQAAQMLPLAPPGTSLQHLAKSPASALLASNFFDFERLRTQQGSQQMHMNMIPAGTAAASSSMGSFSAGSGVGKPQQHLTQRQAPSLLMNGPLASESPVFSNTLDGSFRLDEYHSLGEIYNFINELPKQYKNVQVFTIGHTSENRPIKAIEIINNSTDSDFVWLDALTHAREWITGTTMLYIIDQLVSGHSGASGASGASGSGELQLARNLPMVYRKNYIIIPVVNPDGYLYTWTTNRMWRKNRSRSRTRSPESKCVGADLNRNFDHTFGGEGASLDPCSHIYAGAFPFSEPETKSMADLLWSLKERVKFYLTIHSFNQLWACPYAHTTANSASLQKHMKVLRSIQQAVYNKEGELYEIGPLSTKLYVGSGFGIDFAYDKCAIEHSYLVELRDKGANGFVLPPDQIMPTARETFAGLQAGIKSVFGGVR